MNVAEIEVALDQETTDALVSTPPEVTASTIGNTVEEEAKFVPAIVTDVAVVGRITKLVEVIVGFVSPTVTAPPKETAEPFIVIAPEPVNLAFEIVPEVIAVPATDATLNVPKPTRSKVSPTVAPVAKTTEVPDVTVTSVPLINFTPFNNSQ